MRGSKRPRVATTRLLLAPRPQIAKKELSAEKEEKKNPCFPTARARPGSSFARVLLGLIMLPSLEKSLVDSPHVVGRGAEKKCECAMAAFSVTNKTFRGGYLEI